MRVTIWCGSLGRTNKPSFMKIWCGYLSLWGEQISQISGKYEWAIKRFVLVELL